MPHQLTDLEEANIMFNQLEKLHGADFVYNASRLRYALSAAEIEEFKISLVIGVLTRKNTEFNRTQLFQPLRSVSPIISVNSNCTTPESFSGNSSPRLYRRSKLIHKPIHESAIKPKIS